MSITHKKSVQTINYFARKEEGNSINRLKLMKLLWLSDRLHLLRYGRFVLDDKYVAMEHGPVPSIAKNISHVSSIDISDISSTRYCVQSISEVQMVYFSETEIEVMDEVWNHFGVMGEFELRDLSHFYPEWKRFEERLNARKTSFPMVLDDFFEQPDREDLEKSMFTFFQNENIEESKEVFKETSVF